MSFIQVVLVVNIIVSCAYLIYLWDTCPYRKKNKSKRSNQSDDGDR